MSHKSNPTTNRGRYVIAPPASTDAERGTPGVDGDGQPGSGVPADPRAVARQRGRAVALASAVDLLVAEREELADQVEALEAKVAELEAETASLERTVEYNEREHRQVVARYEHVIAEKEEAYRELKQQLDAAPTDGGEPGRSISAAVDRLARRVKRLGRR